MNQTELNKYKAMLEAKQAELSKGLRNREDIAIEKTPDAIDEVQLAGERELAIRNLVREVIRVPNDGRGLRRIAEAAVPVYRRGHQQIGPNRDRAPPAALQ